MSNIKLHYLKLRKDFISTNNSHASIITGLRDSQFAPTFLTLIKILSAREIMNHKCNYSHLEDHKGRAVKYLSAQILRVSEKTLRENHL